MKNIIFGIFTILIIITTTFISCKKNDKQSPTITQNSDDCIQEVNNISPQNLSMEEIFKQTMIDNNNISETELNKVATRISQYLETKVEGGADFDMATERNEMLVIGLGIIISDLFPQGFPPDYQPSAPNVGGSNAMQYIDCIISAIGSVIGVSDLVTAWQSGATIGTLKASAKFILKKAGAGLMLGYGIYQIGDCLGWW
ncbi:MAG: hypothetical protein R2831_02265 [Chitinophagaceae bacterium]